MTVFEYSAGAFVYRRCNGNVLFLILKKSNGEYDLPKGHIEKSEHAEEAAKREIKEETGLTVGFDGFFAESTSYFYYRGGQRIAKRVKFFLAWTSEKHAKVSYEHVSCEWCDYDKAVRRLKFKDLVKLMPTVREYIMRKGEVERLNSEYSRIPSKSRNWGLSRRFVPGEGRVDAQLMLIGQAPGAQEDERLRPFIGRSGMLLDSVLKKAHISRRSAYITSVVQFFPPKNRMPTPGEIVLCKPFLLRQIEIVKPKFVVLLGNMAATTMLGIGEVEKNHGKVITKGGVHYLITFHPAAALRFKENYPLMVADLKKFRESYLCAA